MLLVAEGLGHSYDGRTVLDQVDLEVHPGRALAITGPSGSGKTTLLALLGGILRPSKGTVTVHHDDGSTSSPNGQAAFVLQTVNVLARRSALDNAALGALHDGASWSDALDLARSQLPRVGLSGLEDRAARSLSGGELQRTVIARALVSARPLILADEPTGQLDRATSLAVARTMLDASRSRTLIIVTHDDEVAQMCDSVVRIHDGGLEQA